MRDDRSIAVKHGWLMIGALALVVLMACGGGGPSDPDGDMAANMETGVTGTSDLVESLAAELLRRAVGATPTAEGRVTLQSAVLTQSPQPLVVEALRLAQVGGAGVVTAAESLASIGTGETATQRAVSTLQVGRDVLRDLLVVSAGGDRSSLVNADRFEAWNAKS